MTPQERLNHQEEISLLERDSEAYMEMLGGTTTSEIIFATKTIDENIRITLVRDEDASNPRDREVNEPATQMLFWNQKNKFGDEHCYQCIDDVIVDLQRQYNPHLFGDLDLDDVDTLDDVPEELHDAIISADIPGVFHGVYIYEHSNFAFSLAPFSCPWDSGFLGFIHMTPATIRENGWTQEQAEERTRHELKQYQQYVNGEVYVMLIYDDETLEEAVGDIYTDSVYGVYGVTGPSDAELDEVLFNVMNYTEDEKAAIRAIPWETP